jgi:glycosyltransferase involved in cell wall biosynthesis
MNVSVVIPLFNSEEWVRETLDSVLAQTLTPNEIVVVDDGSTDASTSVVKEYSRVKLIHNPGNGPNAARNHGFRNTNADAVAFLDDDDLWHPEHLERLSWLLQEHSKCPAAFAKKTTFNRNDPPQYSITSSKAEKYNPWKDFPKNTVGEPALALIRSSALRVVNEWSPEYDGCADYHMWLKLAIIGPLVGSENVTAGYRVHENSYGRCLRRQKFIEYYDRHINASKDALCARLENGLSVKNHKPLLDALRATKQMLQFLFGEVFEVAAAARKIDECLSDRSRKPLIHIWDVMRWYAALRMAKIGVHRFSARVMDLVDRWPDKDSRFRNLLLDWAFRHTSARDVIRRYPWCPRCWIHVMRRGYRKMKL